MNKRRVPPRIMLLGLILLGCLVLFALREPSYQGKSWRIWFEDYATRGRGDAAVAAFRSMGAKAVPHLLQELHNEDSAWRRYYRATWSAFPKGLQTALPSPGRFPEPVAASQMLGEMGPAATSAVPDLQRIIRAQAKIIQDDAKSTDASTQAKLLTAATLEYRAIYAVGRIGGNDPKLVETLVNVRQWPEQSIHVISESARALRDPKLYPAIKASKEFLKDIVANPQEEADKRYLAATALAQLAGEDDAALLLAQALERPGDPAVRVISIGALHRVPNQHDRLEPVLRKALNDDSPEVREAAKGALREMETKHRTEDGKKP